MMNCSSLVCWAVCLLLSIIVIIQGKVLINFVFIQLIRANPDFWMQADTQKSK